MVRKKINVNIVRINNGVIEVMDFDFYNNIYFLILL